MPAVPGPKTSWGTVGRDRRCPRSPLIPPPHISTLALQPLEFLPRQFSCKGELSDTEQGLSASCTSEQHAKAGTRWGLPLSPATHRLRVAHKDRRTTGHKAMPSHSSHHSETLSSTRREDALCPADPHKGELPGAEQ